MFAAIKKQAGWLLEESDESILSAITKAHVQVTNGDSYGHAIAYPVLGVGTGIYVKVWPEGDGVLLVGAKKHPINHR